jgi:lipopolysaccharide transport system ATP-binding protein
MLSDMMLKNSDPNDDLHPIIVKNLGKCHQIYSKPVDRLKQTLWRGRRKYFREFWSLRNIDLKIKTGETVAIIGRNGSGKSTLLQLICGTLSPTEGTVKTQGTIAALLELGSGFNPEFTGIENVFLNASLLGLTQEQIRAKLEDIQAFADIGDFVHQPVKTYSSGMLVRLAFAVVAHVDPTVLIVDEALSVGDAVFGQRCMRFIRRFKERGTLLFVSHDLNAVSSLCERAIWIDSGNLRLDADTKTILTAYTRYCFEESNAEIEQKEQTEINPKAKNNWSDDPPQTCITSDMETTRERRRASLGQENKDIEAREITSWDIERDYGNQNSVITSVVLFNKDGEPTFSPTCGEKITLKIAAICKRRVESLLGGFIIRDRTGQVIFGSNSIEHGTIHANEFETVCISFSFVMPTLQAGSYYLSAAVSSGDATQHEVMHYKPDALTITPKIESGYVHGIFALADIVMKFETIENNQAETHQRHSSLTTNLASDRNNDNDY